ncbi:MAG TPA: zinc ribbon domain-containing protein [Chloroflexia bacterium]
MVVCSNCGFANQPGVNFCTRCGTRLVLPTAPQPSAPPPSGPPQTGPYPAAQPQYPPQQYPPPQHPPNQYPPGQYPPGPGYPPQQYQYPVNQAPVKQGRSPCGCCFTWFLIIIVAFAVLIGAGWFMLQNGTITARGIRNTLGMGSGEAAVLNLTDGDLSVSIASLSTESESGLLDTDLALKPTDSDSFTSISPGRYRITFSATVGEASGDCSLQIGSGDVYQFVAVNEGVVVTNEKYPPSTAADLNMATSSLCKK